MHVGMIGLGRMGWNMSRRLLHAGHQVVAYNRTVARSQELAAYGAVPCESLEECVQRLEPPRVIWCMLPAGRVLGEYVSRLAELTASGDIVIDGGNSNYRDAPAHSERFAARGVDFLDAGVSGGVWGLENGFCLMLGGPPRAYEHVEPLLRSLAPENGFLYCGPSGAGHFVKMVHNGIEYGMMQAYAEGFALLEYSDYGSELDHAAISRVWQHGSVIRSWLLELAGRAFTESPKLNDIEPYVEDSGEGRWCVEQALRSSTSAPVLTLAVMERFRSRDDTGFADKLLAALREQFGGHAVRRSSS